MNILADEHCVACRRDAPRVTEAEIAMLKPYVPEWNLIEKDGIPRLERLYRFRDFQAALAFTQQVGDLGESEGHHPELLTSWGKVIVSWYTHKIKGLHRNDFIMATKTDQLYTPQSSA